MTDRQDMTCATCAFFVLEKPPQSQTLQAGDVRTSDDPLPSCDWGGCAAPSTRERYDGEAWLPVCWACARKPYEREAVLGPMGEAEQREAGGEKSLGCTRCGGSGFLLFSNPERGPRRWSEPCPVCGGKNG